jgi:hypothetical protein
LYSIPEKSTNHDQTYAKRRSILLSCVCLRLNAWQEKKHNQTFNHVSDNSSIEGKIGATIACVLDSIAILRDGHQSILIGSYIPIVYYHHDILIVYTHTHRKLYTHIYISIIYPLVFLIAIEWVGWFRPIGDSCAMNPWSTHGTWTSTTLE